MDWEEGCATDPVRRDFVAPTISRLMARKMPLRVLDVGAGTGFISRTIDELLTYRAHWTLVDRDAERLAVAEAKASANMNISVLCADVLVDEWARDSAPYDAILICFTLLEFSNYRKLLDLLYVNLNHGGAIIIVLPDPWEEVVDDRDQSKALLTKGVSVDKIDKFTNAPYPYHVVRTEMIIESMLSSGLVLESLVSSKSNQPVYVMTFSYPTSLAS